MTEPNITPLARRLAEENGIDWRNLEGTGPDGTIVERDILAFLAKVMAGEVELPPEPSDAPPPDEVPDLSQVQEALAREGVDLGELVPPEVTSETPPPEPEPAFEEEAFFEMDFEEEASVSEPPEAPLPGAAAAGVVEESLRAAAPEPEPPQPAEAESAFGSFAEEVREEVQAFEEEPLAAAEEALEETPWSKDLPTVEETQEALEAEADMWEAELSEAVSSVEGDLAGDAVYEAEEAWGIRPEEGAVEEAPAPTEAELGGWDVPGAVEPEAVEPEPVEEPGAIAEPAEEPVAAVPDEPLAVEEEAPAALEEEVPDLAPAEEIQSAPEEAPAAFAEEAVVGAGAAAAAAAAAASFGQAEEEAPAVANVVFPAAYRRAVDLAAAEKASEDLSSAWRKEVPLELLLFRAVDRALAELEVPMRAVLGRFEGEQLRGLAVEPAMSLRDLFRHLQEAQEEGEGLVVLDLGATPYVEVILPDRVLLTLGRAGMPEGLGLISISGELPTDRTRFLERVAYYLERPILLA